MLIRYLFAAVAAFAALFAAPAAAQACCPEPARCTQLGPGCAPACMRVPALHSIRRPVVGSTMRLDVFSPSTRRAAAVLAIGFAADFSPELGVPLPFDLGLVGFPGCTLYSSGDSMVPLALDGSGHASYRLRIPAEAKWCGQLLAFQALVLGGPNGGRQLASNGLACTVGGRR